MTGCSALTLYVHHTEIACLMLGSMTPELHRQFELHYPYDMIQELRSMFEKQAGVEKATGNVWLYATTGYSVGLILNGSLLKDFVGIYVEEEEASWLCLVLRQKRVKRNLDSTYLWHCRLAHINKKRIKQLQQDGLLKSTDDESFDKCESCLSGKMTKKPFPHTYSSIHTTNIMELSERMKQLLYYYMVAIYDGILQLLTSGDLRALVRGDSPENSKLRYVFVLNGGAVDWKSSKQSTTAMSATESEYIACIRTAVIE
ncbi:retrotransposon protein, putative, ty1-copia subclass [Tanacetum coccineum]